MTIDEAIEILAEAHDYDPCCTSLDEACEMAIEALCSKKQAENNEPLTLEELDKMDGQPVWITPSGFWALVYAREDKRTILVSNDRDAVYADREITLVGPVYRRPPND